MSIESELPEPAFDSWESRFVTSAQFDEPRFGEMLEWFQWPLGRNRKLWEYLLILSTLDRAGIAGNRFLGFGCGREMIPALLTQRGGVVVATDFAEAADREGQSWASRGLDELFPDHLVNRGAQRSLAEFRHVDMNDIPPDLRGFDGLWSCGSLEHIGGLQNGLDFVLNAMDCLKPGGIAVHTTEFNVSPGDDTLETSTLSIYREDHVRGLVSRLSSEGYLIDMNWTRGKSADDLHVDRESSYELSIVADVCGFDTTSIGLIIRKPQD